MIPKIIHYCWFGKGEKSEIIKKCIQSWQQYCPDYEIIEWNEENFDVNCIPYTKQAYEKRKWAFVSDYTRLYVIHRYGGIYLDTDVLLHNSLNDLLVYDCWLAQEDVRYISTSLGFGACSGNKLIKKLIENYENLMFNNSTNSTLDTKVVERELPFWEKMETSQLIDGVFIIGLKDYSKYAKHLATISRADDVLKRKREKEIQDIFSSSFMSNIRKRLRMINYRFKRIIRNPKIIQFVDNKASPVVKKVYLFFAYDFFDYGFVHFIKRMIKKLYGKTDF